MKIRDAINGLASGGGGKLKENESMRDTTKR